MRLYLLHMGMGKIIQDSMITLHVKPSHLLLGSGNICMKWYLVFRISCVLQNMVLFLFGEIDYLLQYFCKQVSFIP